MLHFNFVIIEKKLLVPSFQPSGSPKMGTSDRRMIICADYKLVLGDISISYRDVLQLSNIVSKFLNIAIWISIFS